MTDKQQATLDQLVQKVEAQNLLLKTISRGIVQRNHAIDRLQKDNAFMDSAYSKEHERRMDAEESLLALKTKRTLQHASVLYHDNETKFAELRKHIYNCIRLHLWPNWDPQKSTRGIPVADIVDHVKLHQWATGLSDETVSRRVRELHDPMRLLSRPFVGNYLLAELSQEVKQ